MRRAYIDGIRISFATNKQTGGDRAIGVDVAFVSLASLTITVLTFCIVDNYSCIIKSSGTL